MSGPNEKGGGVCGTGPLKNHNIQHSDFADDGADGKALATMKARAAMCGCTLHQMADGTFLLGQWSYTKTVPCLRAVGNLLRQIGGR